MLARITYLLGGKLAEEIITSRIFGQSNTTEKHSEEFSNAQNLARQMVEKFGMGEGEAQFMFHVHEKSSNYLKKIVEAEIHRILEKCSENCRRIVAEQTAQIEILAKALMRYETMSGEEVTKVLETGNLDEILKSRELRKKELEKRAETRRQFQLVDLDQPSDDEE